MNCNIVKDLIPLYIDGCCSEESKKIVKEHIESCDACKTILADMNAPTDVTVISAAPKTFNKLNDWKASVLQSVLPSSVIRNPVPFKISSRALTSQSDVINRALRLKMIGSGFFRWSSEICFD